MAWAIREPVRCGSDGYRRSFDLQACCRAFGCEHQVCIAHVRKNVRRRLEEIEGWDHYKTMIWLLLSELSEDGGRQLLKMERRVRDAETSSVGGGSVWEVVEPVMS